MATKYPFDEYTRVSVLPAISDLAAPTVAEITAGTDVTCDLTADGLRLGKDSNDIEAGGLCSDVASTVPGRTTFSASLMGFHYLDPDTSPLYDLAVKGDVGFLVVRYGVPYDTDFAASDVVETYDFIWGKRAIADSATDTLVTFVAKINIQDEDDDAVVAA